MTPVEATSISSSGIPRCVAASDVRATGVDDHGAGATALDPRPAELDGRPDDLVLREDAGDDTRQGRREHSDVESGLDAVGLYPCDDTASDEALRRCDTARFEEHVLHGH
jgi:hypothetical protein